ncbi:hypothetical protein GQ457_12G032730 [Hibiscus cannabinus]
MPLLPLPPLPLGIPLSQSFAYSLVISAEGSKRLEITFSLIVFFPGRCGLVYYLLVSFGGDGTIFAHCHLTISWNTFIYVIWKERNLRIFQRKFSHEDSLIHSIKDIVSIRLRGKPVSRVSEINSTLSKKLLNPSSKVPI